MVDFMVETLRGTPWVGEITNYTTNTTITTVVVQGNAAVRNHSQAQDVVMYDTDNYKWPLWSLTAPTRPKIYVATCIAEACEL